MLMKNSAVHLSVQKRVNQGSFYTPKKFVTLAAKWIKNHRIDSSFTIVDSSCGYGAFFGLGSAFPDNRYIGNDIDRLALATAKTDFPFIESFWLNALSGVRKEMFHLKPGEKFCVVGNPPYNDVTSILKNELKTDRIEIDADIFTRDLGLSFLNSYEKLQADYALILHPLSYLTKRTNFSAGKRFFGNYQILENIVFNSQEFADTSRTSGFPIVMALYQRKPLKGVSYGDVQKFPFNLQEGGSFCLSQWDYVADYINKYPTSRRYKPEILFYTLRDINALRRCRTFISERCANAVDIVPEKLSYYCYIDVFKQFAETPYWMGNFDVPFIADQFGDVAEDVVAVSKHSHPDVFGKVPKPTVRSIENVRSYVGRVIHKGRQKNV